MYVNKWLMFNWIDRTTSQYLEPFNFVDLRWIELFDIEVFENLIVWKQMAAA